MDEISTPYLYWFLKYCRLKAKGWKSQKVYICVYVISSQGVKMRNMDNTTDYERNEILNLA